VRTRDAAAVAESFFCEYGTEEGILQMLIEKSEFFPAVTILVS
jgi:hypothetical protein